jgi:hypothetical protein
MCVRKEIALVSENMSHRMGENIPKTFYKELASKTLKKTLKVH